MKLKLTALFLVVYAPLFSEEKKSDPKKVAATIKGKWEVVSAMFNGDESVGLKGRVLEFGDKEFTAYEGDKKGRTIGFTLDAAANPKQIDLSRGNDGAKALGIYSIEKDELKLCYGEPGAERPKKFESPAGDKVFLLVLKRVKAK
jgi:uncharacterized protein (TIGR03067 family)